MIASDTETTVPATEIRRHEDYWRGFVSFMTVSGVAIALLLGAMAYFLT